MADINLTSTTGSGFLETDFNQIKDLVQDGGVTAVVLDVKKDGLKIDNVAVTTTAAELNKLDGVTTTTAELNVLAGIPGTLTATELGYVDGVTSAIQGQIDGKLALTGGTVTGSITLGENAAVALDPAGSADGKYTGITVTGTAGYTQSFGDLVYLDPTDSRWELTDANAVSGADGDCRGIVGMVVSAGTDGTACTILLHGIIRADAKFPTMTINAPMYISETAGAITGTAPTTSAAIVRVVGAALTADELYFNPDRTFVELT